MWFIFGLIDHVEFFMYIFFPYIYVKPQSNGIDF